MLRKLIHSFIYAFEGLGYAIKTQNNFKIHLIAGLITLLMGLYFSISSFEWLVLILCIGLVLFAELINTALETIVDLISPEIHPLAKISKDLSAASVLVLAIMTVCIAGIIFIPYLF